MVREFLSSKLSDYDFRPDYAEQLTRLSDDVLQVGESSLYPALQRLLLNGYLDAEWAASDNNRRARYHTLTVLGRKYFAAERANFES